MLNKRSKKYFIISLTIVLCLLMTTWMTGCKSSSPFKAADSGDSAQTTQPEEKPVEGIAAKGKNIEITEQEVSDFIKQYRMYSGTETDAKWATFLDESGKTVEDIRKQTIEKLAVNKIIEMKAAEKGISVDDEYITSEIDKTKEELGLQDDADGWKQLLETTKFDSDSFRADVKLNLLTDLVVESEVEMEAPTDAQIQSFVNSSPSDYTGKKTITIVYPSNKQMEAKKVAKSFENGTDENSFRTFAAEQVERDIATRINDFTWSCLIQTTAAFDSAIENLKPGEVTYFQDNDGTHRVVLCTASYIVPYYGNLIMKDMPDEIKKQAATDYSIKNRQAQEDKYKEELLQELELEITPMPENLPYAVDMENSTYGTEMTTKEKEEIANQMAENRINELEKAAKQ